MQVSVFPAETERLRTRYLFALDVVVPPYQQVRVTCFELPVEQGAQPSSRRDLVGGYGQCRFDEVDRVSANHDFECAWLDDAVHVAV